VSELGFNIPINTLQVMS